MNLKPKENPVYQRVAAKSASRARDELALSQGAISREQLQELNGGGVGRLMRGAKIRRSAAAGAS